MERDIIREINKKIDEGNQPIVMTKEEIKTVINNPLTKSRYGAALKKSRKPRPSKNERITCDVCGRSYTQSNVSHHRKSKHHLLCKEINNKFLDILYDR